MKSYNQEIVLPNSNVTLFIKREDLLHPFVSGNKFRKLKYNLVQAQKEHCSTLLTFGGAFSNHIAAVAYAGYEQGFRTIGVIRGEELDTAIEKNPTLSFAKRMGMEFYFVSREQYRLKEDTDFIVRLREVFGEFYLIPEGGTNAYAVQGCEEILTQEDFAFDYIACCVGTGGTISGIINSSGPHQVVLGFPALKGDFLPKDIRKFAKKNNWELLTDYHFGGYAKVNPQLIQFLNDFYADTKIPLDPVYTGKMMYGIMELIGQHYFKENAKILVIHTGGLQGIQGMNAFLERKKLKKIEFNG
jgi:1-aminocyclopropane-1-carboxylate deaminase